MANNPLLAAADELERQGEALDGSEADFVVGRELAELAARLRHAARWLDRPAKCRCLAGSALIAANQNADKPLLLTREETANRLSMSLKTLDRMVEAGELRPLKRGRYVRFAIGQIEQFEQKGEPGGTSASS
jgi:excisionase family DNA binding protein